MTEAAGKRLAIIGGGSSGLVTLKYARDMLPDWELVCFEKTDSITGAWGNPYPGFVSTSTKYTTQFACFPKFDASVSPDGGESRSEFFREGEYGEYLTEFAEEFGLRAHIQLRHAVESVCRGESGSGWDVTFRDVSSSEASAVCQRFDAVVICTGLAARPKAIDCDLPQLSLEEIARPHDHDHVCGKRIVVVGGGESAVDVANRLAHESLNTQVYLSLRAGIRVSPRYHPIRGVPSDFLRNRLMLSIHEDIRNAIGQRFVESRIRYRRMFEWLFPAKRSSNTLAEGTEDRAAIRKEWDYRLTRNARDDLFNMFHNKSDDFLDAVAEGRIKIIGPPTDASFRHFREFASDEEVEIPADFVAPSIGYRSCLSELTNGELSLSDFYLACCHVSYDDLFLVGHARPVIGNIPSISEMQAIWAIGMLSRAFWPIENIKQLHEADLTSRRKRFSSLDLEHIFPVEMFPYCDRLAEHMLHAHTARNVGLWRQWWRMQLTPATTLHYQLPNRHPETAPIYMPPLLIVLLLGLKPIDWMYRIGRRLLGRDN